MPNITEYGDIMTFGTPAILDEWGRRKIDSILEDGTRIIIIVVVPPIIETIVAKDYPMNYLPTPVKAEQLTSKVSGATIIKVSQDYPLILLKKGKAEELRSKWT